MEFESVGHSGMPVLWGRERHPVSLESGANKTPSPSSVPSCLLMNKVLQKFGEKEENGVALFRGVMVGQVQGHRGVQIPSLPAKSADGLEQVVSSCSECFSWPQFSSPLLHLYKTCCVPWAVFPP